MRITVIRCMLVCLVVLIVISCKKTSDTAPVTPCDPNSYNSILDTITEKARLTSLNAAFGSVGNNYSNVYNGTVLTSYYKWTLCANSRYYFRGTFRNDSLISIIKSFDNTSCSAKIDSTTFSTLTSGLTFNNVTTILQDQGDKYRVEFDPASTLVITYYRFYSCADHSKYFLISFRNNLVYQVNKYL